MKYAAPSRQLISSRCAYQAKVMKTLLQVSSRMALSVGDKRFFRCFRVAGAVGS